MLVRSEAMKHDFIKDDQKNVKHPLGRSLPFPKDQGQGIFFGFIASELLKDCNIKAFQPHQIQKASYFEERKRKSI